MNVYFIEIGKGMDKIDTINSPKIHASHQSVFENIPR